MTTTGHTPDIMSMNKHNGKLTIVQIAELAGVSVSTVSRVINGNTRVNDQIRERVQRIIHENNYHPNQIAQGLANCESKSVALIIPDVANPFFADIIHGVENELTPYGYSMYLCNSNFDHERETRFLKEMEFRCTDGVILISTFLQNETLIRELDRTSMRIVCIQTQIEGVACINTNDYDTMYEATSRLISMGHKRIGYICYDRRGCRMRYSAYRNALAKNGIQLVPDYIAEDVGRQYADNPGYHMAKKLLSLPNPPTAIQTLNDVLALGVYQAAQEMSISIPEDLSVIGYDDLPISRIINPPLTTIRQPAYEMGKAGTHMLLKLINNKADNREHTSDISDILFLTEFLERGSIAPPKK